MAPEGAARLAATLGLEVAPAAGEALPIPWHWAYFLEPVPRSRLGPDGHPRRGDALAGRLPRRMAASGAVTRLGPLVLGQPARRQSELVSLTEKEGRSGPLAFADWRHVVEQEGAVVIEELQTLVYRGAAIAGAGPAGERPVVGTAGRGGPRKEPAGDAGGGEARFMREVRFDPPMLFRFSALTWNSHRIHYDVDYATKVEGYPALVVHGPLLATLLAGEAAGQLGALGWMEYRARAPVFVDEPVHIFAPEAGGGALALEARKMDGTVAMTLLARGA